MKHFTAAALVVCMSLCFCACANTQSPENTDPVDVGVWNDPQDPVQEDKLTYTVTVEDENGKPLPGVTVLLCLETGISAMTDEQGTVHWSVEENSYMVTFASLPDGYDYATDVHEFYFDDNSTQMTLTLIKTE